MPLHIHVHHHPYIDAVSGVTRRLDDIEATLGLILTNTETEMAQSDDLNNAVTSLASGFAAEHTAVQAELTAIAASIANQSDPALTAAVTQNISNISAITGTMATDAAALTASIPAATTVPPPVVTPPVVPPTVTPPVIATPPVTDPSATPPSTPPASATTS
jgi:hypothetical protein